MTPKPSVQVAVKPTKHQNHQSSSKNVIPANETDQERAIRKAEAAMEAEIKRAKKEAHHRTTQQERQNHGVVYNIIAKHKAAIRKRDEQRAALRKGEGESQEEGTTVSRGGEDMHDNSSENLLQSSEVRDTLEVVDTEIHTVSTLSNIARSIMVPTEFAGKPPLVTLSPIASSSTETTANSTTTPNLDNETTEEAIHRKLEKQDKKAKKQGEQVDKHVKAQLKRKQMHQKVVSVLKGTWTFIKTPLGILFAIYGFLVVFGGAALVICLAGWVPGNKDLQVEIFSQIENGLFTIPGVGLIPWRLRDTYIIARICHYRNKSNDLRKKRGLPPILNANDLAFEAGLIPAPLIANTAGSSDKSLETPAGEKVDGVNPAEYRSMAVLPGTSSANISMEPVSEEHEHMLSPKEAAALRDLQRRFAKNCTWYRPNETPTHYAYPIGRAVTVTAFIDMNSVFQCLLCGYMWGYASHYHDRPSWSTGTFLPLSFVCGIVAAIVIWVGGKKSHKKAEVEERLKAAFDEEETGEA